MEALFKAVLHTLPIFGVWLLLGRRGLILAVTAIMVVIAVASGSSAFLALDLMAIGVAAFICLTR